MAASGKRVTQQFRHLRRAAQALARAESHTRALLESLLRETEDPFAYYQPEPGTVGESLLACLEAISASQAQLRTVSRLIPRYSGKRGARQKKRARLGRARRRITE